MKKTKKGFTIVELIIVIAVIAVLTAILVPTFIHLNNKANEAADKSLVTNLNKALAMREAEEGEKGKNMTMYDCVEDLRQEGYSLPQLATRSGQDLVWSQKANRFFLSSDYNEVDHGGKFNCWHIYEQMPKTEEWAIYPNEDTWKTADVTVTKVGFDAGKAAVSLVSFETQATANITIRTNGGNFTVNAPNATVSHYADVYNVTVSKIAGDSYHEYGRVLQKFIINQGHAVVEQTGEVPEVSVENATGAVTVTANTETTISVDSGSSSQTKVEVNAQNVFVDGVDQSKISGSEASNVILPTLVTTESQLRNVANGFAKLGADISINTDEPISVDGKALLNLNGHNITFGAEMGDETSLYQVTKNGYLSVSGSGKITVNARMFEVAGELRVEGGTFVETVMANSASKRSIIISEKDSLVTINGGDFYAAKCVAYTKGELVINDGTFTSIASTAFSKTGVTDLTDCYAYVVLPADKTTINGGRFYGVHGGFCQEGGRLVFNDAYVEVSNEAFKRFSAVQSTVHYLNDKADTITITADYTAPLSVMHYAAYLAGESFTVTATINGGEFVTKGNLYAVHVGNSTYGDGGERLPAFVSITGGKFISENHAHSMHVDKYVGTLQVSGGNFNKEYIQAGGSTMKLSDADKVLVAGYQVIQESDGTWSVVKR